MKFHLECKSLCFLGFICIADMPLWNRIQQVSCCVLHSRHHLNHWYASMKFYPDCEPLCTSWALFKSLTCSNEILFSMWVAVCFLGSIWITDMLLLWNHIKAVSCYAPPELYRNHWLIIFTSCLVCAYLQLASLALLSWQTCILQVDHVKSLVYSQFKVRPYLILCLCVLNYIGILLVLSHWSD